MDTDIVLIRSPDDPDKSGLARGCLDLSTHQIDSSKTVF